MPVCQHCSNEFPNRVKFEGKYRNLQRRKYCLDCSPFGDHNTKQIGKTKLCGKCGETNPSNFSDSKFSICKKCHGQYTVQKGRDNKDYVLEKLGGRCTCCGFDKYPCSLDIHHTDPSVKDEHFRSLRGWSKERIDKEIESCIILCRNCHSAYHNGYIAEADLYTYRV